MIPLTRSRLIVLAAVTGAVAVAASPAGADSLPSGCAQSGQTVTCRYAYTGGEQQFVVPAGVTGLHVDAVGARGSSPNSYPGEVVSDLAVTPGQTLYVEVGGRGGFSTSVGFSSPGGFNGGGDGGAGIMAGGGGGGASDVRTCSSGDRSCDTLGSRLVVAAGGGGLGGDSIGGNGGAPNGDAASIYNSRSGPGGGATQTDGGSAGSATYGRPGAFGQGGSGGGAGDVTSWYGGGGGGGGWYGGGGGDLAEDNSPVGQSTVGGGGGGSSHGPAGSVYSVRLIADDPAWVNISYAVKPADTTAPTFTVSAPQDGATYAQGQRVLADYSCSDEQGGSGLFGCGGNVAPGAAIDTSTPGTHSFVLSAADNAGNNSAKTITYTVKAADTTAPKVTISTPKDGATYTKGQRVLAVYSCSDDQGGYTCVADTGLHAPVDTSTNGSHSFTVTATDAAGNRVTKTVHYTVGHPRADVRVAIGGSAASIQPRGAVTQTVTVTNTGPSPAGSIATVITVPRGLTVTGNGGGTVRNRTVRFAAPSLDSGASLTYTLVMTADPTASGRLAVQADALASTADPNLRNNGARDSVQIVRPQRRTR